MDAWSYDALVRTLGELRAQASFLRVEVIGRSLCGRGLFALRFGARKSGALIVAGLDGSRQTAGAALLAWAQTVCRCLLTETPLCGVDLSRALSQSGVTILPCMNPDGLEIALHGAQGAGSLRRFTQTLLAPDEPWRGNAAGVRLERQFPFAFDLLRERQALQNDPLTAPLTEPEARALVRFCRKEGFARVLLLEEGTPLLSVFPAGAMTATRETVIAAKLLAACACVPFALPTAQESCGTFPGWFAETMGKTAFSLALDSAGDAFYRRIEEALVLYGVL